MLSRDDLDVASDSDTQYLHNPNPIFLSDLAFFSGYG